MDRGSGWAVRTVSSLILAYLMLRPVSHGSILYPLLAILAIVSTLAIIGGRRRTSPDVASVLGIALLASIYGTALGAYNPGISQDATVWLLGPVVFGLWALSGDLPLVRAIMSTAAWATIVLSLIITVYVASQVLGRPSMVPAWLLAQTGAGFDVVDGATAIRFYGLSTLTAAAPMWIIGAFVRDHPLLPRRWVRIAAGASATAAALLGGRNAIVLVIVLVPLLLVVTRTLRQRRVRRKSAAPVLGVLAGVAIIPFLLPVVANSPAIQRTWTNIVAFFSASPDQSIRTEEAEKLLDAWAQHPFFGSGLGATIPGYARSIDRPWNFELQYHLILFQFGVVGTLILAAAVLFAVRAMVKAYRLRPDAAPVILVSVAGAVGMLISNATNPYLQAPGHMWTIWLPLLVANAIICAHPTTSDSFAAAQTAHNALSLRSGQHVGVAGAARST